jgi:hypothetical protein
MTTLEILQKRTGTAKRLQTIFAYHYDQILRECEQEILRNGQNNPEDNQLYDYIVSYMEEIMDWPSNEDQDKFNHRIANEI